MKMFVTERRDKILQLLSKKKRITVKELVDLLNVSEATLRADLNKMEQEDLLIRTHGGAIFKAEDGEPSFSFREKQNKSAKEKIAERAVDLLSDKQCVLLDGSSTALEIARVLKKNPIRLTVITSGLYTALELADITEITVIQIGGMLTNRSKSIEGLMGSSILKQVSIDLMFTSANGFTIESGLTDFNLYEVQLKKEMVSHSKKIIALIDDSKIGHNSSASFAHTREVATLITNKQLSNAKIKELQEYQIDTIIT